MKYKLKVYLYEFYVKNMFLKVLQKKFMCGIIEYNFSFYVCTSSLSFFPGRAFIYMVSIFS